MIDWNIDYQIDVLWHRLWNRCIIIDYEIDYSSRFHNRLMFDEHSICLISNVRGEAYWKKKICMKRCATHSVEAWCSLFSMVQPVSMPFMVASRNTMCYQMVVLLVGIRAECRYVQIESIKYEKPIGNDSISYTLIVYEKDTGNNPISEMHTTCQRANNICVWCKLELWAWVLAQHLYNQWACHSW